MKFFQRNINKAIDRARKDEREQAEIKLRKSLNDLDSEWKDRIKIIEAEYQGKVSSLKFEIDQNAKMVNQTRKDATINREAAAIFRGIISKLIYLSNKERDHGIEIDQEFMTLNTALTEAEIKLIGDKK
jgi:hypothetical protein